MLTVMKSIEKNERECLFSTSEFGERASSVSVTSKHMGLCKKSYHKTNIC